MRLVAIALVGALLACQSPPERTAASPRFAPGGPDAEAYGAADGYPIAVIDKQRFFVAAFSHYDQLFESRKIRKAERPSPLQRADAEPAIRYRYDGRELTLDDYLARNPTTALLIARGNTILAERYQYGRTDTQRFTSFSMAKTVVAMLIGIAIAEGRIGSIDDLAARYVPALASNAYGQTSIRHLLQMSSGVRFEESYNGRDDVSHLWFDTVGQFGPGGAKVLERWNERPRWPGAVFSYSSAETQVLGLVLVGAVGRSVAQYLQEKIWSPMGAEADASWLIDASGQEAAYCCLNAVLRDYARLALLLAHDGRAGERQLIPADWLRAATTVAPEDVHLQMVVPVAGSGYGYGYQTWVFNDPRRMFALIGYRGQAIYVDPASRLVMVHLAVRLDPTDLNRETLSLWRALVASHAR